MIDLLQKLWPNFSYLASNESGAISVWFWIVMSTIAGLTLVFLVVNCFKFRARMKALNSLLSEQDKDNLVSSRREIIQKANELKHNEVRLAWIEFDESLVVGSGQKQLFSTVGASYFFNEKTLARGLTGSRLLAAVPSFLVAIGVLGTFVGLTMGLSGLVDASDEVEVLKGGINELISGASVAFMTSVWGVLFSLCVNIIEKFIENRALKKISKAQQQIDALYQQLPAEQSLLYIVENSRESKLALQELHERIGDRLQETVSGMSEAMQSAVAEALNTVMAPAVQALVENSNEQSTQTLKTLVEQFMSGMASAGQEQSGQMQQAAAEVNAAVSNMGERLDQLFTVLSEQQSEQLELVRQQNTQFGTQLQELTSSSDQRQAQLEERFGELMSSLSDQIQTQLSLTQAHDEQRQASFTQHMSAASENQTALLEKLSNSISQQVQTMAQVGAKRDKNFENVFSNITSTLNEQLESQLDSAEEREQERHQRFNEQLEAVAEQQQALLLGLAEAVTKTQQQSIEMAQQHQDLLARLQRTTETVMASSKHMDSSANQLGILSTNVRSATEVLGQSLNTVTESVGAASKQSTVLATQLKEQADSLGQLQVALLKGAERFEEAAAQARNGFSDMQQAQEVFLQGVKNEFVALGETLRSQVEAIEKQAESWLQSYAEEVHRQTDDRMNKWNEVSLNYADQMHRNVQAVSGILDELEAR